ncbi:MAG: hypothetical protein ACOY17_06055 [Pseudomonadota bacterium]|jgi:hypothetical protein|nr:hypothetical protein [Alphaproteobacteria bacterium]
MIERLLLIMALFGIVWLMWWLIQTERAGESVKNDKTPFAMRPGEDILRHREAKKKKRPPP